MPKLKLMLNDESIFMRTKIDVNIVREYLAKTDNQVPDKPLHPAQILSQKDGENQLALMADPNEREEPEDGQDNRPISTGQQSDNVDSSSKQKKENLRKVLSHKAIQIGQESGVTAEFIVKQTGE